MPTYYNIPNLKVSVILPVPRLKLTFGDPKVYKPHLKYSHCAVQLLASDTLCLSPICHLLVWLKKVFKSVLRINTE